MKKLFFLFNSILIFQGLSLSAQWFDDFSDQNLYSNPYWYGDTGDFIIQNETLRLLSPEIGMSQIYAAFLFQNSNSFEWSFDLELDFAPSINNKLKVVVFCQDTLYWNGEGLMYYLNFGENGSADAIELWKRVAGEDALICRGEDALIASSFHRKYKILYSNGLWEIQSAAGSSPYYTTEVVGVDTLTTNGAAFFALHLNYTSSNTDAFFFDDIFVGEYFPDTISPQLYEIEVINDDQLRLSFSEALDSMILDPFHFQIIENGSLPFEVIFTNSAQNEILISFQESFPPWSTLHLQIDSFSDLDANATGVLSFEFVYGPLYEAKSGELRFNEIMADPSPAVALPNAEYIEIFNTSDSIINVASYAIINSGNAIYLDNFNLLPDSFLIICKAVDQILFEEYGATMGLNTWQTLLNSGDSLELKNRSGLRLDHLYYLNTWVQDPLKAEGGWSLERIDPKIPCYGKVNWKESESIFGGTPGKVNSVYLSDIDNEISILQVFPIDSSWVEMEINGELDTSEIKSIISSSNPFFAIDWENALVNDRGIIFECFPKLEKGKIYHLEIDKLRACHGSDFYPDEISFSIPEIAKPGDIIINELLFNAYSGGNDFIEIYNRSPFFIDLKNWRILEKEDGTVVEDARISESALMIAPQEILAFSRSSEELSFYYSDAKREQIRSVNDLPNFPDDEAEVCIVNADLIMIDSLNYSEKMHFSLLEDLNGISIERIHPDRPSNKAESWISASEKVQFASPGYQNSHFWSGGDGNAQIALEPKLFTPNDDGDKDLLHIRFNLDEGGWQSNIKIYNDRGMIVKNLISNYWIENKGSFEWDGSDDNKEMAKAGIYLVYFEVFNDRGEKLAFKKVCVLGNSD